MSTVFQDRKDFDTHLKYVALIARLAQGLTTTCAVAPTVSGKKVNLIEDKVRLVELTRRSIADERKIVHIDPEYSTASVLWLPIKSYYVAYHLLCVIDFILTADVGVLKAGHGECIERFTGMLRDGTLQFSEPLFNQVFDYKILDFKTKQGEHLRNAVPDDVLYKLAMKKIALEKIETYKTMSEITNTRTKKDREKVERFKRNMSVSIFDFFYQMRLRLNYRNFDFIDDIPASQTKVYFERYYEASDRFHTCFSNWANQLLASVSGASF